jgi:L-asparagine oxygenase
MLNDEPNRSHTDGLRLPTLDTAPPTWNEFRVAARAVHSDPFENFDLFVDEVASVASVLPVGVAEAVTEFAAQGNSSGALLIRGTPPLAKVPPTPAAARRHAVTDDRLSEIVMVAVGALIGHPLAYQQERDGAFLQDVHPVRRQERNVSSQSSAVDLGYHSEMMFHPTPPDMLMLYVIRQDPGRQAVTQLASAREFLGDLRPTTLEALRRPEFMIEVSRLHSPYLAAGRPVRSVTDGPTFAVLAGSLRNPVLRFEPELTRALTSSAERALVELEHAVLRHQRGEALEEGSILLIDNRSAVHARTRYEARYDGSDRWLRRMHLVRDKAGDVVRRPVRLSTDLLEGWSA